MHRYIAFTWSRHIAKRTSLAMALVERLKSIFPQWHCALATDGLYVYHSGERAQSSLAYPLDQNVGVVLGKVFRRRLDASCDLHDVTFSKLETQNVRDTKGRHLIEHYWGRYVAMLRSDDGVHVRILRDPTGAMPCLLTNFHGIDVVCSHINDCAALGLINCAINWDHVAAYLWFDNIVTETTGLNGVRQIQAGECVTVDNNNGGTTATFYWSPARFHDERTIEDRCQAMRELRHTIRYCVGAWTSCYNSILHGLSGGLDSAVVLACLSEASGEPNVVCENYFTQDAQGDERVFAQKAAIHAGVELIETPLCPSVQILETMLDLTKFATPTHTYLTSQVESIREETVKARNIEAIFSGQGGDHFFQQTKTPLIAAEYAWRHGLGPKLFNVITDTARFTRRSVWSVMAVVLASGLLGRREDPYSRLPLPPLLSDEIRDALDLSSIRHGWIYSAKHIPDSKLLQFFNIIDSQNFYNEPCHYADIVHPLISQPIIELCLQIPCYVLTYNGIDRALVREAFTGLVPSEITRRTVKGATTSYANGLLVSNIDFLQAYLLDGLLVGKGVLDRKKTEASLNESELIRNEHLLWPMLSAVRAESWLRGWIGEGRRVAA